MRILDPVHKYIIFPDSFKPVVDSTEFQRLRYIRQLGFAEFSFPGAVHNRFLHSIGVCHLAGRAFDIIFSHPQAKDLLTREKQEDFRKVLCLSALLHDAGHGPLSHTSETAMPKLSDLKLPYDLKSTGIKNLEQKARHEHYSVKLILESDLKNKIQAMGVDPAYPAHLIDELTPLPDKDFFISRGVDFKNVLKQIISSELDVDRMDYLQRDSFFCGTDYGFCDHEWILNNFKVHLEKDIAFLAVSQKAMYSVENFLLGRRYMSLAVYFHNKMVIMEEMLKRYFLSPDCSFRIPVSLKEYLSCTDGALYENLQLAGEKNEWARRIVKKQPFERVYEIQYPFLKKEEWFERLQKIKHSLQKENICFIHSHSLNHIQRLYFSPAGQRFIYVLDELNNSAKSLNETIKTLQKEDHIFLIDRLYTAPENKQKALKKLSMTRSDKP